MHFGAISNPVAIGIRVGGIRSLLKLFQIGESIVVLVFRRI